MLRAMTVPCYGCDPVNPDRFARHEDGRTVLRIPARFEGPPGNVNGGLAAGALTCPALEAAQRDGVAHAVVTRVSARLHKGVPHSRDLAASVAAAHAGSSREESALFDVTLLNGGDSVISGAVDVRSLPGDAPPGVAIAQAPDNVAAVLDEMAAVGAPESQPFFEVTGDHPVIGCFSCGPRNARGLHVFPRFAAHGVTWASWAPERDLADAHGGLAASIIAAALDCSSGVCMPQAEQEELLRNDQFYLLGSFDVRYLRTAPVDAVYHVVGRARGRDGRKFHGVSALFDDHGTPYAFAEAVWIVVNARRSEVLGPPAR